MGTVTSMVFTLNILFGRKFNILSFKNTLTSAFSVSSFQSTVQWCIEIRNLLSFDRKAYGRRERASKTGFQDVCVSFTYAMHIYRIHTVRVPRLGLSTAYKKDAGFLRDLQSTVSFIMIASREKIPKKILCIIQRCDSRKECRVFRVISTTSVVDFFGKLSSKLLFTR